MAILIYRGTKVLIQGITGRFGQFITRSMLEAGTNIVAGVAPGRGGLNVWDTPVYNTVAEAWEMHGPIEACVIVVPAPEAKQALTEALTVKFKTILMEVERVPLHDTLECIALCRKAGVRLIGPGSAGLVSPGKGSMGILGASEEISQLAFQPGRIGIISRSAGQTTTLAYYVCRAGYGISTAVHLGCEQVLGTTFSELLPLFQDDPETEGVVYYGEIGGVMEEEAAKLIEERNFTKPLIACIAGKGLPAGMRFSHASAIIEGGRGTVEGKIDALNKVGAFILENPEDLGNALESVFVQ